MIASLARRFSLALLEPRCLVCSEPGHGGLDHAGQRGGQRHGAQGMVRYRMHVQVLCGGRQAAPGRKARVVVREYCYQSTQ